MANCSLNKGRFAVLYFNVNIVHTLLCRVIIKLAPALGSFILYHQKRVIRPDRLMFPAHSVERMTIPSGQEAQSRNQIHDAH